jgi:hypothetical protein
MWDLNISQPDRPPRPVTGLIGLIVSAARQMDYQIGRANSQPLNSESSAGNASSGQLIMMMMISIIILYPGAYSASIRNEYQKPKNNKTYRE